MVLATTHLAAGLAVGYLLTIITGQKETWFLLFTLAMGDLPDLDFVVFGLRNKFTLGKQSYKHRSNYLHTPIIYLLLALLTGLAWGWQWGVGLIGASWLHLILDSLDCSWGIKWFWPCSNTRFRLFIPHHSLLIFKPEQINRLIRFGRGNECLRNFWSVKNPQFIFEILSSFWLFWQIGKLI